MAQVTITMNGRTYKLACGDGEEPHVLALAGEVGSRLDSLKKEFGQIGDDRLLLMAGLMMADELQEVRQTLDDVEKRVRTAENEGRTASQRTVALEAELAKTIEQAAERLEMLAGRGK